MADTASKSDSQLEKFGFHNVEEVAMHGHVATDAQGHALVSIDEAAEKRLTWKIDLHVIPIVAAMYLFCFIDRANIGNAKLAGLEKDIGLKGYDYNILLTAFYAPYCAFEIPANLLCKKIGPGKFIPILTFFFGLFSFLTGFVHSRAPAIAVRFFLGVTEAGVFPGIAFYLSRWYRRDELTFRLSLYVVSAPLAGAFGGLLASGILKIHNIGWLHTWRNIFFIEGLITMTIAVIAYFLLTDRPETAKWLTVEEKALAAARIKSENVGQSEVIDSMHGKSVRQGIFAPTTLVVGLIFLLDNVTVQGLGFFLPTIIKTIYPKKTTVQLQLRTVPPYIVGAFFTLLLPYMSWKTKKRALWMMVSAPFMIAGYAIFLGTENPHARYGGTFLIAMGAFSYGPLTSAWVSANVTSDTARAAAIGTNVMMGSVGGLIATWSYLPKNAPNYVPGNALNTGTSVSIFFLAGGLWLWQIRQNRLKESGKFDHLLEGKSQAEIELMGTDHPGFKFQY